MRRHAYLTSVGQKLAAVAFAALAPAAAEGASYCVTCTGPDQTYVCNVTGEGTRRTDALKLYCIVRTAKEGGHAIPTYPSFFLRVPTSLVPRMAASTRERPSSRWRTTPSASSGWSVSIKVTRFLPGISLAVTTTH